MPTTLLTTLTWAPRLMGAATALFISLFALDAFDGRPVVEALPDFFVHLLPALAMGAVVLAAWRLPVIGAAVFAALAVGYAVSVPDRPDWIAVISGPLAATSALYATAAYVARPRRQRAG